MSIELLLPAGSFETFTVAVNNGADAVYIGGSNFSARANAVNFTNEEIVRAVKYAHVRGVKVYVALNTLVEDSKLSDAVEFAKFCYLNGVDALIVQDLGLLKILRETMPELKLNASTQMTIHNTEGVKTAEKLGFSRVVLSRELGREEIKNICKSTDCEIEVFAHGALCMSYSGQCLMSSFIGGRSGNRGACAQPCRLPYTLLNDKGESLCENKYLLSLKDLCLLDKIGDLDKIGVNSLKIEGRMKNASYVAMTAHLFDKYKDGTAPSKEDMEDLKSVFSRNGFTKGYYENSTGRNMLNFDSNNDNVYVNISDSAKKRAEALCHSQGRKISVFGNFEAVFGRNPKLCVWDNDGHYAEAEGASVAETARTTPLNEERVRQQITKTGATPFAFEDFSVNIAEGISIPVKDLNEMRRSALCQIEEQRGEILPKGPVGDFSFNIVRGDDKAEFSVRGRTYEQIKVLERTDASRIYIPESVYLSHKEEFDSERFFVCLPAIDKAYEPKTGYKNISVSNISQIFSEAKVKHADARMNIFNSVAVKFLKEANFSGVCLSPELNLSQVREISKDIPTEVVAYGYIPVMTVQNCVVRSAYDKCACDGSVYYLKDRKGAKFPVVTEKGRCTNIILNSAPIYMGDKMKDLISSGVSYALLDFTIETPEETERIFKMYQEGKSFNGNFTRGHFYRGV